MYCLNCKNSVSERDKYCCHCGSDLNLNSKPCDCKKTTGISKGMIITSIMLSIFTLLIITIVISAGGDRLSGRYVSNRSDNTTAWIFTGNRFTVTGRFMTEIVGEDRGLPIIHLKEGFLTGKYSISGNKIELTWDDDGRTEVYCFSRTDNTITISGNSSIGGQFVR